MHASRRAARPGASRATAARPRPLGRTSALALIGTAVLVLGAPSRPAPLPACDAPPVRAALAATLERIPALAGRRARLLRLEGVRVRGHAGRRPMRACQGRLVTSAGAGSLEYSIRRGTSDETPFVVRAELFQGGWRRELVDEGVSGRVVAAGR